MINLEEYPKNENWEYVIPVSTYMALSWVPLDDWIQMKNYPEVYKYVMFRLRRCWLKQNTCELVHKFIEDYFEEKKAWNE